MYKKGFIIAGTNSGCGKTTVTSGILSALVKRGLRVQPYKVGPDYLDPMYHTFLTGRYSRNLDSWMLDDDTVRHLYVKSAADADIVVVEGVMGLYDGYGGRNEAGSTAHMAKLTGLPVILVVDPEGMALSAAALIKGFLDFDTDAAIKGIILNNISSEDHYRLIKGFIEEYTGARVLGYLKNMECSRFNSRHLGLVTAGEVKDLREKADKLCRQVEETFDMGLLLELASEALPINDCRLAGSMEAVPIGDRVRLAVAYDKAFCFYYWDNLELLEELGAELVYFSPLADDRLPPDIDGLYMGGGYPELWADELQDNSHIRNDIRKRIEDGLPAYAECGGLMYMCRSIADEKGGCYEMAGVIAGRCHMTSSLKRFGYANIEIIKDNVMAYNAQRIRCHEFHYSDIKLEPGAETCYHLTQKQPDGTIAGWDCGLRFKNLLAGYAHIHFWSNPSFASQFVESCRQARMIRGGKHES